MWSAISKIFTRNYSSNEVTAGEDPPDEMDRGERKTYSETDDSFTKQVNTLKLLSLFLSNTLITLSTESLQFVFKLFQIKNLNNLYFDESAVKLV